MDGNCPLPSRSDVRARIVAAIHALYRHDWELLDRDANERSLTHKLAEYLQREFPGWHVDCEYNRLGGDPKRLNLPLREVQVDAGATEARTVFPDIIIHRRGTDLNLVVLEVKKLHGTDDTQDQQKIKAFSLSPYRYEHGLMLRLGAEGVPELRRYCRESEAWDDWSDGLQPL